MKKLIFTVLWLAAVISVQAQLKYGVKVGLNMSNVTGDVDDTKAKAGALVGVFARYSVNENLAFQPELLYSMQGCKVEGYEYDYEYEYEYTRSFPSRFNNLNKSVSQVEGGDYKIKLDYLLIPIMVKYYPIEGLNLQVGPQFGFLLKAEADDEDIKDDMKKFDFGFNVGAGYDLPVGLGLDARYYFGLTNASDGDDDFEAKNGVFSLALSYSF